MKVSQQVQMIMLNRERVLYLDGKVIVKVCP